MEKVAFALDMDDDWPPVATEHVWCDRAGTLYELGNVPFFIKGLALGDRFSAVPDPANGCIFEFSLVEASGHSLAWIVEPDGLALEPYKEEMFSLGLRIEVFSRFQLHAVDVPATADAGAVNALMDRLEDAGFAMAFPVWPH